MNASAVQINNCQCPIPHFVDNLLDNISIVNWKEHTVKQLEKWETKLDKFLPPFNFQNSYDRMMEEITKAFSKLRKFDHWLENNSQGNWYSRLATFLAKLPLKAARNILQLISNIILTACRIPFDIAMHPIKTPLKLAKLIIMLVHSLTQPETWTKMGSGIVGSSLANIAVTSNPLSIFSIAIGGALILGGISIGTLKTALFAQKQERWNNAKNYLTQQVQETSEALFTGFCLSLLIEGIQQLIRACQKAHHEGKHSRNVDRVNKENQQAQNAVNSQNQKAITDSKMNHTNHAKDEFLNKYQLPNPEKYDNHVNSFTVRWRPGRTDIDIKELPEGALIRENLQTGVQTIRKTVVTPGHYQTVYVSGYYNSADQFIDGSYRWVWVDEHLAEEITKIPIYEQFFGYRVPVSFSDWTSPSLLPAPTLIPLPIKPALSAALRLSNAQTMTLAAAAATAKSWVIKSKGYSCIVKKNKVIPR